MYTEATIYMIRFSTFMFLKIGEAVHFTTTRSGMCHSRQG